LLALKKEAPLLGLALIITMLYWMPSTTHYSEVVEMPPVSKPQASFDLTTADGRIKYAMDFFTKRNYTDAAAAGIIGNLVAEVRDLDPTQKQYSGGPGRGILQWTKGERWASLQKWATGRKLNPMDFETQIAYIDHELKSYSSRGAIDLKAYKASKDVRQATEMLMSKYVRPGKPRLEERLEGARGALRIVGRPMADDNTTQLSSGDNVTQPTIDSKDDFQKISDKLNKAGGNLGALTEQEKRIFAERYSYAYGLFVSNKELMNTLRTAIKENWTDTKFKASIQSSKWYQARDNNQRLAAAAEASDSKSFETTIGNVARGLSDRILAVTGQRISITDPKLLERAKKLYRDKYNNWKDEVDNIVKAEYLTLQKSPDNIFDLGGLLGTYQDNFMSTARSFGQRISDDMAATYAMQVAKGDLTEDDVIDKIRRQAAGMFPGYRDLIMQGINVDQISDTYRGWAASLFEVDEDAIDISDPSGIGRYISDALSYKDDKGNYASMPLGMFKQQIRNDPKWQFTENARNSYLDFGTGLLRQFGYTR
jgi:hypothetical protein